MHLCQLLPGINFLIKCILKFEILDEGESFLQVDTEVEAIRVVEHQTARWIINISSFPKFSWLWKTPTGKDITALSNNRKYSFGSTSKESEFKLEVFDATLHDSGNYPFIVQVPGVDPYILNLTLTVKGL